MEVTEDLLTTFNISLVVRGTVSETAADGADADAARYAIPRAKGVFRCARMCCCTLNKPTLEKALV